ncbi:MAG: thioredoxin domain-containing protein, partial [Micrococcales bacterium]|nr:thioredoxin domain-containing protein [Micrococcales bacterium]
MSNAAAVNESDFEAEVLQSDKPVIVDFWAEWCGPCRMVGPVLDSIAEEHDSVKVVKVNVDDNQAIA